MQFPDPGMQRLLQDYGDSSPVGFRWNGPHVEWASRGMGLTGTFMGASQPNTMFAGWMEPIGGLLCSRRTQLVGTLAVTPDGERAMLVKGEVDGVPIEARCEWREPADFTLMSRGFHWTSEYPLNR